MRSQWPHRQPASAAIPCRNRYCKISDSSQHLTRIIALLSHKGYQSKTIHVPGALPAVKRPLLFKCSPQAREDSPCSIARKTTQPDAWPSWCAAFSPSARSSVPSGTMTIAASGLSSLDMVNLMLAVEAEFDLKIPDREMTPSNFRSIAHIVRLVHDLT